MTFEQTLEQYGRDETRARTLVHADGSRTFVMYDTEPSHADPRDDDGNVAVLVSEGYDYNPLDEPDSRLAEARERWGWMDHKSRAVMECAGPVTRALFDSPHDREAMVNRYIAMFRPDIAYYCDEWEVTGVVQGEWRRGWGYVTTDAVRDLPAVVYNTDLDLLLSRQAKYRFDAELDEYRRYFAGEVYGGVHVEKGEPIYDADFTGATLVGHEAEVESVWGFLGYDDLADIGGEFTDSPVVEAG